MSGARLSLAISGIFLIASLALAQKEKRGDPDKQAGGGGSVYAELASAPAKARAKRNPLEGDPDAPRAGGKLFARHCAECHGASGEGSGKAPSLLAPEVQNAEPGALYWVLTNGVIRRGMPVWSKLPEPQRWQLVAFVKSLGTKREDEKATTITGTSNAATAPPSPHR